MRGLGGRRGQNVRADARHRARAALAAHGSYVKQIVIGTLLGSRRMW
jgi:hypothetical protein